MDANKLSIEPIATKNVFVCGNFFLKQDMWVFLWLCFSVVYNTEIELDVLGNGNEILEKFKVESTQESLNLDKREVEDLMEKQMEKLSILEKLRLLERVNNEVNPMYEYHDKVLVQHEFNGMENMVFATTSTFRRISEGVILVVFEDGRVVFYNHVGEIIQSDVILNVKSKPAQVVLNGQRPVLYVHTESKDLYIVEFGIVRGKECIVGNVQVPPHIDDEMHIVMKKSDIVTVGYSYSNMAMVRVEGKRYVAGVHKNLIQLYSVNGTYFDTFDHVQGTILAIRQAGQVIALAIDHSVRFLDVHTKLVKPNGCFGLESNIQSIAFHRKDRNVLFAGTNDGNLLVFNRQSRVVQGIGCRLVHRIKVPFTYTSNIVVETLPGYVAVLGGNSFVLYNVTDMVQFAPRQVYAYTNPLEPNTLPSILSLSDTASSRMEHPAVGILHTRFQQNRTQLVFLYSYLPYYIETYNMDWIRIPFLSSIALVVFYMFFVRSRSKLPTYDPYERPTSEKIH